MKNRRLQECASKVRVSSVCCWIGWCERVRSWLEQLGGAIYRDERVKKGKFRVQLTRILL